MLDCNHLTHAPLRTPPQPHSPPGVIKLGEERGLSKCTLVYGQMNEPPGARARVALTGLTVAEYFRDVEGQDVLLFVDNIFRFTQANSEVSALLGRIPSAVGYQPTLATDLGGLQERITTTTKGSITSVQAVYVPADDLTDPAPATTFAHLDATTVLSRSIAELGIYPAVDPLDSTSRMLDPRIIGAARARGDGGGGGGGIWGLVAMWGPTSKWGTEAASSCAPCRPAFFPLARLACPKQLGPSAPARPQVPNPCPPSHPTTRPPQAWTTITSRVACRRCCRTTRTCRTSSPSWAWTSSARRTSSPSRAHARSSASCRSPSRCVCVGGGRGGGALLPYRTSSEPGPAPSPLRSRGCAPVTPK